MRKIKGTRIKTTIGLRLWQDQVIGITPLAGLGIKKDQGSKLIDQRSTIKGSKINNGLSLWQDYRD
jgi:hypothetical protein